MATIGEMVTRLDIATNRIAEKLQELRDRVAQGDADIAAQFEPLITELEQMGTDPTDPVPDPAPEPSEPIA
ncbi:MAG: hypothetical protein ACRDTG_19070 [Pseudonocardiaceae bacterium]